MANPLTKIDLRHLHAFIAVAEESSFRAASQKLYIAQPALSRTIQQLEGALDVQLLIRSTRSVEVTEAGRHFLLKARAILADLNSAVEGAQCIQQGTMGELFVGFNDFSISDSLPSIVHQFRALYPGVKVNLIDATSTDMIDMLQERRLDIAFPSGVTPDPSFSCMELRQEELVCVLPQRHPLESCEQLNLRELKGQPFVMGTEKEWKTYLSVVSKCCEEAGFTPNIVQRAVHSDGIINLVAAGMGVTVYVQRDWLHRRNDIVVKELKALKSSFGTYAVWRKTPKTPVLQHFLDVLFKCCG